MAKPKADVLALLLMVLTLTLADPGVKLRLTDRGIQYGNSVAEAELNKALRAITIPNQSGKGSVSWEINNIQPSNIRGPNTQIQLNPSSNGLTLRLFNFGVDLRADWRARKRIIFRISVSGSVEATFDGASLSATIGFGEQNGRPSIYARSCNFNAGSMRVKFHGGFAAWVLNIVQGMFKGKIRDWLQSKACDLVIKQINENANDKLSKLRTLVNLGPKFQLDYSLVGNPLVTDSFLESNHKGAVYWRDAIQDSPVPAPVFPPLNDVSNMLCVVLTDYTFNTFAYQAHKNNFLAYNIGLDNISPELVYFLSPTAQIGAKYPNSKLEFRIYSAQAPLVTTQEGQLTVAALGNVDVLVTSAGTEPENILTLGVNTSIAVQPALVNDKLTASIGAQSFLNFNVKKSSIGDISDMSELNSKLNGLYKEQVIPALNYLGGLGLELPVTGTFRLTSSRLDVKRGGIIVATDVELI